MKNKVDCNKEYGGFLPLELNQESEYYNDDMYNLIRFNSIKAAIRYTIRKLNLSTIYIPVYYCQSTAKAIADECNVKFYHVDEQLIPFNLPSDKSNIALLLVDYFGIRKGTIKNIAKKYKSASIFLDLAHDFFSKPVVMENVYNFYSAKKFFGVPDGAYLIAKNIEKKEILNHILSYSCNYNQFLFKSYEEGTNAAYKQKKESDKYIAQNPSYMSSLAAGILRNVNYEFVMNRRRTNFITLHKTLNTINNLEIIKGDDEENCNYSVYHYPLMLGNSDIANNVRKALINERIYSPILWNGNFIDKYGNDTEYHLGDKIIFIPIDQRYEAKDMEYITERILFYIDEYT